MPACESCDNSKPLVGEREAGNRDTKKEVVL